LEAAAKANEEEEHERSKEVFADDLRAERTVTRTREATIVVTAEKWEEDRRAAEEAEEGGLAVRARRVRERRSGEPSA
jgi:hypothetical protein